MTCIHTKKTSVRTNRHTLNILYDMHTRKKRACHTNRKERPLRLYAKNRRKTVFSKQNKKSLL